MARYQMFTYFFTYMDTPTHIIQVQKCDPFQLNRLSSWPFWQGAFHLTQTHPQARNHKHGRSLTVMPWTTIEFNVVPETRRMGSMSLSYSDTPQGKLLCHTQIPVEVKGRKYMGIEEGMGDDGKYYNRWNNCATFCCKLLLHDIIVE